jgi:hypothetical protein
LLADPVLLGVMLAAQTQDKGIAGFAPHAAATAAPNVRDLDRHQLAARNAAIVPTNPITVGGRAKAFLCLDAIRFEASW